MKKLLFIITGILFSLYISGCKVGPNAKAPEIESPTEFRFDTTATHDSIINLRWWELFNDPTLDSLIEIALIENKDVLIAAKRIEQSRATLNFTKADMYPTLSIAGNAGYGNFQGFKTPDANTTYSGGAQLAWEMDFWGKFRRANESARSELLATEFAHRQIQIDLISQVAESYFQLLDYKLRLEISIATLDSRDSSERIIAARFNNGIVPELDLNQAQIQTAIAQASVPKYKRWYHQTENALSVLLGRNPNLISLIKTLNDQQFPDSIPVGIPSSLLTRRPDIMQQEQKIYAQNAMVGVAVAQRFPSISLTGMLGAASNNLALFNSTGAAWNVGAGLLGPIFQFGKNKRRVEIEKIKTEQEVLLYEKTVIQAFSEVEDALISTKTWKEQFEATERQVKAALNARFLAELRYDKGVTSYLEVIEYQRTAFDAELTLSRTRRSYLASFVQLYKALGGGWISEQEETDAQQE
jgi:multidrug efflux system outer membrane protein